MSALNRFLYNTVDMYTQYGFIVTSGSDSFLQLPNRKAPVNFSWPDQDGTEYDLTSAPVYEDREIVLKGFLVATSELDFWTKYNALKVALDTTGTKPLKCVELDMTINVFYKSCSNLKRRTPVKNTALIGMELEIVFQEVI